MASSTVPPQKPLVWKASPESIVHDAQDLVAKRQEIWDSIVQDESITPDTVTIENTLLPIIHNENIFIAGRQPLRFISSTSPVKELRDASRKAAEIFAQAHTDILLHSGRLHTLIDGLIRKANDGVPEFDSETRHFLTKLRREFLTAGLGLPEESREMFRQKEYRLHEVQRRFIKNIDEDKGGVWLSLSELEGVPESLVERLKKGEGEHEGLLLVNWKRPVFTPVLKYAKIEATRRRVYTAMQNRQPQNIDMHREIVLLRNDLAHLLGYPSYMALQTEDRMVQTPQVAQKFLADLRPILVEAGKKEVQALLALKAADAPSPQVEDPTRLYYWDESYYERIADEKDNQVDFTSVSEYFETWTTLRNLVAIYEHIFDISFELVTPERGRQILREDAEFNTWHEDVKMFLLWDVKKDSFLGYIYFDLFPRDGKYSHAGHYSLVPGYTKPDGTRAYPTAAIVMNFPVATLTKPSLLTLDQTRSLFHEIGHSMHNLLSVTQYARFHGCAVDMDFVETPSVMFESFLCTPRHIRGVSQHYAYLSEEYEAAWLAENHSSGSSATEEARLPPEKLPDDVVAGVLALKFSNKPLTLLTQLHYATYDILVHDASSREDLETMALAETFNRTRNELKSLQGGEARGDGWAWGQGPSVFRAINGGKYAGGYYAYVLGRIWALDIFETNLAADTMSKEAGRKYREQVLRVGGTQPAKKTLYEFLGREPSQEAYNKWIGLGRDA